VEVHLGARLSAEEVAGLGADAVVVATGGRVVAPRIPGDEGPRVIRGSTLRALLEGDLPVLAEAGIPGWQRIGARLLGGPLRRLIEPRWLRRITRGWMPLGRRVAILGGDLAAVELAEFLAERRRRVTLLETGEEIAPEVGLKRRTEHMDRLDRLGVAVHTGARVERITEDGLRLEGGHSLAADSVIVAGEVEADTSLYDALKDRVSTRVAVGDCTGLGLIRKAIEEGARAACSL
jgi:2,4-dienoyl-CoA reductase (NADPH2)